MSSYSVPVSQYANSAGVSSTPNVQPQQPIHAGLDFLEKALVELRDEVGRLEGRLIPVMAVGPTRAEGGQGAPQIGSALTARLAHLHSVVGDIIQTVNTIHTQLEL